MPVNERDTIAEANSLFEQPWWLNAVAPGQWNAAQVIQGGHIKARLPYYVQRLPLGVRLIRMPRFTPTLGPWLEPSSAKYVNQLSQQKELISALVRQLPSFTACIQTCHYSLTNCLPFWWMGFEASVRYTYVIDDLRDLDRVWADFSESARREVRKAEKHVQITDSPDIERLLRLSALTFTRQGRRLPYDESVVRRLDHACAKRNARRLLFAEDAQGRTHAAVYLVWDDRSAYYLIGGGDPDLRTSGATSLLMWRAIQFASTVTSKFDFEGSMIEPVERFFRSFGAKQIPYFQLSKASSLPGRLLLALRPRPAGTLQ